MFRPMSEKSTKPSTSKRGRKPLGEAAMTAAERKRRSREQLKVAGAKDFLLRLDGLHLEYVEILADAEKISTASALRLIAEAALDRYVGVMTRCERMLENGVSDDVREQFVRDHMSPPLPPIDARKEGGD
jgi:hypothetical protein